MSVSDVRLKVNSATRKNEAIVTFDGSALLREGENSPSISDLIRMLDSAPLILNVLKNLVSDYQQNRYASSDMSAFFEARDLIESLEFDREA